MYKALLSVVVLFCLINYGFGGTVEPEASNVTVIRGKMLEISWTVSPTAGERVTSLQVYVLPNITSEVLAGSSPLASVYADTLFGVGRLSATFAGSTYKLMLKNVSYADSVTFQLFTLFVIGTKSDIKTSDIQVTVNGKPSWCGMALESNYSVNETETLTVRQGICGYPKPDGKWRVGEDNFEKSYNVSVINTATRHYEYTFKTRSISRTDCGKNITFSANNTLGSVTRNAAIDVTFKPLNVSFEESHRHNASCIYVAWYGEDTGNCIMNYHLQFLDKGIIYNTFTTPNTNFTLCNATVTSIVTNVSIWASYKGSIGQKNTSEISANPPTTTTTTTTKVPITPKKSGDGSNIGLIIAIVGGILIVIIIIIIVVCVLKHKKKNGTGNHSGYAMRVTGEENNYVTDPTNLNRRQPANPDDPEQAIYSELGPGGGRTGPRPAPEQSDYAEMKVDAMGYPIDGAKASEPPTYAPVIKPREGAKRRTPSPPRSNVDAARAAGSAEPPAYAPIIKNRSSSRGRSPPPDEDNHEGVIV
uniref:Allorecognition 1 n=2 Tax=Hydractinia symbiolongicarpus TaxID=13093 RepID=D9ZHU1_HYDSY|nr:allorecognition 1 [Hydractinia symbiolongicarpus]